ncbi:MAG: imidazole glycerol phosphate synthase subunit HisH [Clostridiales bacterium]|nr:imidazole glycerol phosphate synthase subunit HisH [Clostridiales bacterium]
MSLIGIIDYGAGNLHSVKGALDLLGVPNFLSRDCGELEKADSLILPGVGAFPAAMDLLKESGLVDFIKAEAGKKPLLGICLGMQMLLSRSYEFRLCGGLDLIPGSVVELSAYKDDPRFKIPHMGWNILEYSKDDPLFSGIEEPVYAYFVHSFKAVPDNGSDIAASTRYGEPITAAVHKGNVWGTQFHPEKSGEKGLMMLKNFASLT